MKRLLALAAVAALSMACSDDARTGPAPAARAEAPPPDASVASTPTVFLRTRPRAPGEDAAHVTIEVVARDVAREVHGAALRLRWEPGRLRFEAAHAGAPWSSHALALAKEGAPGELALAWTERGDAPGITARGETVLGTVEVARAGEDPIAIAIRAERSTLRDRDGASLDVTWRGADLDAR